MRFRIMTFNIGHSSVRSLLAPWETRRPLVTEVIRSARPDAVCLQEASERQLADLESDLEGFECSAGAPSGPTRLPAALGFAMPLVRLALGGFMDEGERCPILLRSERLRLAGSGSAGIPPREAVSFGTPHVLNWVHAVDVQGGARLAIFNTHLGLLPWRARETAKRVLTVIDRHPGRGLEILAGDLNSRPRGATLRTLLEGSRAGSFRDAWAAATERSGPDWTYHGGRGVAGARIDYVLVRPGVRVAKAEVTLGRSGRGLASDHCALTVELEAAAGPR